MLRKILITIGVLVVAVAGLLLYASLTQPDTFRVQRCGGDQRTARKGLQASGPTFTAAWNGRRSRRARR